MRLPLVLALPALPLWIAGAVGCGGPVFSSAASDASTTPSSDAAGGDTGGGSGGGGGTFCAVEAGTHTFCDDFDGPPLAAKWASIEQVGGGTAVTDLTTSYSSPGSLETVAPASVNATTRGRVVKSFGTASRVVLACEVWLDATPPKILGAAVGGDSVLVVNVGSTYSIAINAHTDQVGYVEESSGGDGGTQVLSSKDLVATSTLTGWIPVSLTVDLAHASLSITIGGVQRLASAPITPPSGQSVIIDVGAFSHNQTQNLAAHYDNVTIDITP
jgi:hypothetical protein